MNSRIFFTFSKKSTLSKSFVTRRLHSLSGLAFTLFLCEHLLTNSLSPLWINGGNFFVKLVNQFHRLPYLHFIEIFFLACPFIFHALLGIRYALEAKFSGFKQGEEQPYFNYERNHAYFWQRCSAWILLLGITMHVVHMRFVDCPKHVTYKEHSYYVTKVKNSQYLKDFAKQNRFILIYPEADNLITDFSSNTSVRFSGDLLENPVIQGLISRKSIKDSVLALQTQPGKVFLLVLWNTFSSSIMCLLYSILVLLSVYHGCNGIWLFMMRWGFIASVGSQKLFLKSIFVFMGLLSLLGFFAIWGMFWSIGH